MNRQLTRTAIAVAVAVATMSIVGLVWELVYLIGPAVIGVILIGLWVGAAVWFFDWYTDRTTP